MIIIRRQRLTTITTRRDNDKDYCGDEKADMFLIGMERKQMIVDLLVLLLLKMMMAMIDLATAAQIAAIVVEMTIDCPSSTKTKKMDEATTMMIMTMMIKILQLLVIPDEDKVNKGKPIEYKDVGLQLYCSYCCYCCGGDNQLPIIPLEEDKSIEDKKVVCLCCCCCGGDFLLSVIPSEDNNTENKRIVDDKKGEQLYCCCF